MLSSRVRLNLCVFALGLVILAVGVWLRLALYDVHGLEGDDGVALSLTRYDVPALVDGLRQQVLDVHPPLYFLLLKGWISLAGESLLALRIFNIAAEGLTAACLWALLRTCASRKAAVTGVMLWTIAPLLLYGFYTIRMYTLLALWVTAGTWCLSCFVVRPRLLTGVLLGLLCMAALMTHLYGVFLWGAAVLVLLVQAVRGRLSTHAAARGGISLGLAALVFVPFGVPMLQRFLSGRSLGAQAGGTIVPLEMPGQLISAMLTYRALTPSLLVGGVVFLLAAVALVWLLLCRRASHSQQNASLALVMVCGAGIAGVLVFAVTSSVYRPRYAVPFVPLLLGVVAVALTESHRLRRKTRQRLIAMSLAGAGLLALVMLSFVGLVQTLGRNVYDDWRGAADYIQTYQQPGDVIVVIPRWGTKAFEYHNASGLPVQGLFESVDGNTDLNALVPVIANAERVWLISYQIEGTDPAHRAEAWLQTHGTLTTEIFPTAMQVRLYDLHPTPSTLPTDAVVLDAQFGEALRLRGYRLPVTSGTAREIQLHPPSNWVQPTLYFEPLQPLQNVTLRVRLVDTQGGVWGGALERGMDVLHQYPLSSWAVHTLYEVTVDLNLNPDTPPGFYRVEVMLLDAGGAPLPASGANAGANWIFAGEFQVR